MKNRVTRRQLLDKIKDQRGFTLTSTKGFLVVAIIVAVGGFCLGRFVIGEGYLKKSAAPVRRWHQPAKPVIQTPDLQEETVISEPVPEVSTDKIKRQQPEHSIISTKEESGPEPSEKEPVASSSEPKPEAAERPAQVAQPAKPHQGKYTIQAGVFVDPGNSQSLVEDLKKHGYQARVKTTESRGKKMHKVRLGSFDSREAAQKTAEDMKRQGYQVIIIAED